jgi:hypothetical protein
MHCYTFEEVYTVNHFGGRAVPHPVKNLALGQSLWIFSARYIRYPSSNIPVDKILCML